jgi:LacI family transcriptional regulator
MFKPTTIKDIANALSLSPSTVSRALRDSFEIGVETKQLVLNYAKKVKYKSNPNALSLRNKRSYSIGVIVADVANSFFSQTINGIESVAYEKGYHIIITQSHDSYEREMLNIEHLANRSVDGLLISMSAQTTDYSHIKELHDNGLPIVFFDRILEDFETSKVTTNNFDAAYKATEMLILKGHRRIAHLANAPQLSITIDRMNGYAAALKHNKIAFDKTLIKYCTKGGRDSDEVDEALNYLLLNEQKPDAILIASDRICTASMRTLSKTEDFKEVTIVGFSNSDVIDLLSPKISYVRQPAFEMGQVAAEMLISIIENKKSDNEYSIKFLNADIHWLSSFK